MAGDMAHGLASWMKSKLSGSFDKTDPYANCQGQVNIKTPNTTTKQAAKLLQYVTLISYA